MNVLVTNDLTKIYKTNLGDIRALDDLNIKIPAGSTAFLGPNGSGKSTLIKIALGLIQPTSGSFELFGETGENYRKARNKLGYMPETPSIISKVNAVKFVKHFGILSGLSFTRSMQRAHEVLDYVGLHEERYREIDKYSTGMKQRLLLAQSLVHDPEVIILDEPTTGLSPEGRSDMLNLIHEIMSEYGKSIIFSTHILPDVDQICDYTVLINQGKEVFQGPISEISELLQSEIILDVQGNLSNAQAILDEHEYEHTVVGNQLVISNYENKNNSEISYQHFANLLTPEDIKILSIKNRQPNLEDLFLHLIDRDIDDYQEEVN